MDQNLSRRRFLKLAGATTLGLGAAYVVPKVSTVKAGGAYSRVTGVIETPTPRPCNEITVEPFHCQFERDQTTIWFRVNNDCDRGIKCVKIEEPSGLPIDMSNYIAGSFEGPVLGENWLTSYDSGFPGVKFRSIYTTGNLHGDYENFIVVYQGNALNQSVKFCIEDVNGTVTEGAVSLIATP